MKENKKMKISDSMNITLRKDDILCGVKEGETFSFSPSDSLYEAYKKFYEDMKALRANARPSILAEAISNNAYPSIFPSTPEAEVTVEPAPVPTPTEILLDALQRLMDFFTEFSFTPSFRFTNTFSFMACQNVKAATEYVNNYFALMDSSYAKDVTEKLKSAEFKKIVKDIAQYGAPASHINNRFKVYFGPAGTGKTTIAQEESENRCIVCNSSMLPSDLMEDFVFTDGNPDFNPSLLWDCMEQGKTIVLDEINLLPFDSLRFLQGIVDGKTEFYYKNRAVHIHEGFQIIGTMNLSLGGMVYGLPEPLVDRCSSAKEFTLSAKQLAKAIAGWDNI